MEGPKTELEGSELTPEAKHWRSLRLFTYIKGEDIFVRLPGL